MSVVLFIIVDYVNMYSVIYVLNSLLSNLLQGYIFLHSLLAYHFLYVFLVIMFNK